jgi:hypothetical protein
MLRAINAATEGIPVDFSALIPEKEGEPIGIGKLWEESKKIHAEKINKGQS